MKKLIVLGSGGFAREVVWLVERINKIQPTWDILGFTEENSALHGTCIDSYKVLGDDTCVKDVVCAVGTPILRKKIIDKIKSMTSDVKFATLIDPTVEISESVSIGEGTIICAHTIATVNIKIGAHVIVNLNCTIGHDTVVGNFVTVNPGVNISGNVDIGNSAEIGTGTAIIQGKKIGVEAIIGAGAVVTRDIEEKCTAVGVPAKPIKYNR